MLFKGSSPLAAFFVIVHLEGLLFQVKVARLLAEYRLFTSLVIPSPWDGIHTSTPLPQERKYAKYSLRSSHRYDLQNAVLTTNFVVTHLQDRKKYFYYFRTNMILQFSNTKTQPIKNNM